MWRFLAGVGSTLLLVAAGLFWWSFAHADRPGVPDAPFSAMAATLRAPLADPPAASDKTREEKRFSRYDHDKNGAISRDEYLAARRKAFAKLDTNQDGKLSFDEYAVKTAGKFAKADMDRSGVLTPAEFATTRVVRKAKPVCKCVAPPAKGTAAEGEGEEN